MDIFAFFQTDTAMLLSILIAAWLIKFNLTAGAKDNFGLIEIFYPISFKFLEPLWSGLFMLLFYGIIVWFAIPFLMTLGFPLLLILMLGFAYVAQKALGWPLPQSFAVGLLAAILLGIGI